MCHIPRLFVKLLVQLFSFSENKKTFQKHDGCECNDALCGKVYALINASPCKDFISVAI